MESIVPYLTESQWLQSALLGGIVLFVVGLYLVLTRRNVLMVLMGIELMLNAANVNFVVFSKYHNGGTVMVLFVMIIAAAEAAVGLAIILSVWKVRRTTMLDTLG